MKKTYQKYAEKLLPKLEALPGVSWTPNGELVVEGRRIMDSNIKTLIQQLSVTRGNRNKPVGKGMPELISALKRANIPSSAIGNKFLWESGATPFQPGWNRRALDSTSGATGAEERSSYYTTDDDDDDDAATAKGTTKKKAAAAKSKQHKGHGGGGQFRWMPYRLP